MTALVGYLVLFVGVGVFFLFFHLMIGKLVRPNKPDPDKLTIYECGEPTIGSAWIQFDLRFYVVALLFVIFDVEVAFFFPWAVVFGKANAIAKSDLSGEERLKQARELDPELGKRRETIWEKETAVAEAMPKGAQRDRKLKDIETQRQRMRDDVPKAASQLAWLAFWDLMVFFAVLLVGFAYLWRRGDLDWVRSTAAEKASTLSRPAEVTGTNGGLLTTSTRAPAEVSVSKV
jgi:NADH-quinone oxidoreductase subunit A